MTAFIFKLPSTAAQAWAIYAGLEREALADPWLRIDPDHRRKLDGAWQRYERARGAAHD